MLAWIEHAKHPWMVIGLFVILGILALALFGKSVITLLDAVEDWGDDD